MAMDFLVFDGGDFLGAVFGVEVISGVGTAELAELADVTADELGLAIDILMTMVVFGFQHHASTLSPGQQKTVQKISVN